jgi:hypothetical protein
MFHVYRERFIGPICDTMLFDGTYWCVSLQIHRKDPPLVIRFTSREQAEYAYNSAGEDDGVITSIIDLFSEMTAEEIEAASDRADPVIIQPVAMEVWNQIADYFMQRKLDQYVRQQELDCDG